MSTAPCPHCGIVGKIHWTDSVGCAEFEARHKRKDYMNYTQQCRTCHVNIEGTGEDICYRCLQHERDSLKAQVEELRAAAADLVARVATLTANGSGWTLCADPECSCESATLFADLKAALAKGEAG